MLEIGYDWVSNRGLLCKKQTLCQKCRINAFDYTRVGMELLSSRN